jgi:glycine oxidase
MATIVTPGGDVAIVGAGLVGLATAAALAARGANVTLISTHHAGEASRAAAGMLAPGMESGTGPATAFALAARDLYPSYIEALAEVTGTMVPLNREGVLELFANPGDAERRESAPLGDGAVWLTPVQLHELEPALSPMAGAVLYPLDGAVDNVELMRALHTMAESNPGIAIVDEAATGVELDGVRPAVRLSSGATVDANVVVLAAGAWTPGLGGLPRPIPVEPVRGQMIALDAAPLRHVAYSGHGYVVPRDPARSVVGSTMEHAGFDSHTTEAGLAQLHTTAVSMCPALAAARTLDRWCGLRPVTSDLLPILGPDPDVETLYYACGHSRNGSLLGPLSGECVAALIAGETPELDLSPFSVSRFTKAPVTV